MPEPVAHKYWWIVIVVMSVLVIGTLVVTDQWLTDYRDIGAYIGFGLIGVGFTWVYSLDREHLWWAIIPGLSAFTLLASMLSDLLVGTSQENDWVNVLVIAFGAAVISAVLKRPDAKTVLAIVATFAAMVGILMSPLALTAKVVLVAALSAVIAYFAWQDRGHGMRVSPR